jgi:hypothetical protein
MTSPCLLHCPYLFRMVLDVFERPPLPLCSLWNAMQSNRVNEEIQAHSVRLVTEEGNEVAIRLNSAC